MIEFDLNDKERLAVWSAIIEAASSEPYHVELQDRMLLFAKLLMDCGEVGTTLHVN